MKHRFIVEVLDCTLEQAEQVMAERINVDEDYGFDYRIDWEPVIEQPPIGGICDECGHFAGRHDEAGCHGVDPAKGCRFGEGSSQEVYVACDGMKWQGRTWPRPWLPYPEGLQKETVTT
jgi:hypothetical protein